MVNASRCNLLSRSLPNYQKAMLAFSDSAASEFHRVLVELRSHHHHQYKLHSDMVQIRDLEAHEFTESELLSTLEGENFFSALQSSADNDDDALLDMNGPRESTAGGGTEVGKEATEGTLVPLSPPPKDSGVDLTELAKQEAGIANDLPLSGVEADLRALQRELLQEFGSSSPPRDGSVMTGAVSGKGGDGEKGSRGDLRSADMDLNDLLGMGLGLEGGEVPDFGPLVSSEGAEGAEGGEGKGADVLIDQWNNFSSFMGTTRTSNKSSLSEWEREFSTQPPTDGAGTERDPFEDLDPLAAAKRQGKTGLTATGQGAAGLADDLLSLSLGSAMSAPPAIVPSLIPSPAAPINALPPSSLPYQPLSSAAAVGGASSGKPHPPPAPSAKAGGKDSEKKGSSWMNVFAHLDPLSNEKA